MPTTPATAPRRGLVSTWLRGWSHIAYQTLSLLTGLVAALLVLFLIIGAMTTPLLGVGLLILTPTLWAAWVFARAELVRIESFTGRHIEPEPLAHRHPVTTTLGLTRTHGRAAAYSGVHFLWGLLAGSVVASIVAAALAAVAMPLYAGRVEEGQLTLFAFAPLSADGQLAAMIGGALVLLLLPLVAAPLTQVDLLLARALLARDAEQEIADLSQRVETLTVTRSETVDSVEAERRRIERDLHDGPQQRLVAIAMDLGMARERLAEDPAGARELLDKAHAASKEAIVEMRHVARGITPPILADRGLDAAISALAIRSSIPTVVRAHAVGRLDPTTEAIAYYCVSELLTNVAKHSGATQAVVSLQREIAETAGSGPLQRLVIKVEDDGHGGVDPRRGTGLVGLRQRVTSVDGELSVQSPEGGPTRVLIHLPERSNTQIQPPPDGPVAGTSGASTWSRPQPRPQPRQQLKPQIHTQAPATTPEETP